MANKKGRGDKSDLEKVVIPQALVIADSFDRRFSPISLEMPRALMPIANVPMLDYTIELLAASGIQEIYVFCQSHAKAIENHLAHSVWQSQPGLKVQTVVAKGCTSMGEALREVYSKGVITSDFILVSGDVVSNVRLMRLLEEHRERKAKDKNVIMTMLLKKAALLHPSRSYEDNTVVALDPVTKQLLWYENMTEGRSRLSLSLDMFAGRPSLELRHDVIDCHIDICSPEVLFLFYDNPDYQHLVKGSLSDEVYQHKIFVEILTGGEYAARAKDMRTYAAISRDVVQRWTFPLVPDANFSGGTRYAHQRGNIYLEAPVKMSHTALVQAGSVVGAGTSIGAGSTIRASVLGRRCQIGADVFIENSFLWDDVVVEDCAVVRNSIVCSNAVLRQGARVEHDCVVSFGVVVGVGARLEPGVRLTRLQPSAAELEFDAEPTAPIALGEGGVGRRWVHVLEELENSLAVPGLQPRVSSGTLSSASDADLGIESESDEESEAAELDPQERLFHEVQDTILSNAEISAAMLPSLATELHTRIFAHNKELNLGMQDVAKPVLRTLLELIVSRAPKKASQKDLLALMTSTLKKWSTLLRYFVGNSLESQISILCTTRDYCEKDRRGVFDKLIPFLFRLLYEEDVVAEEAFLAWEERESRVEGAAAFLKKAELFLKWIREADEESEEEEDEN